MREEGSAGGLPGLPVTGERGAGGTAGLPQPVQAVGGAGLVITLIIQDSKDYIVLECMIISIS